MSLCFKSLYTSKSLPYSYSSYGFFGVDISQKMSCVQRIAVVSSYTFAALSAHSSSLPLPSSFRNGSKHRTSSASFFPSDVTFNMLSSCGLTLPPYIASARFAISSAICTVCSLGSSVTVMRSASGTSSLTISAVCTSAKLRYKVISSGRLVNLANLVRARYPCPLGAISKAVTVSPKSAAQPSK